VIELKEFVAESRAAAVARAAAHFGVPESRLEVRVISDVLDVRGLGASVMILASRGQQAQAQPLGPLGELARGMLQRMRLPGKASVDEETQGDECRITLRGEGIVDLIRRNDALMPAVAHLLERAALRAVGRETRVRVEFGLEDPAEVRLDALARSKAEEVRRSGKPVLLDAMGSRQRWIVHNALRNELGVRSESIGEGRVKRVKISPV
jgi:predicted RNA-binding protein Jag